MKLTKFTNLLVLGLVLTLAASGCRKSPHGVTPLPGSHLPKVASDDNAKPISTNPDEKVGSIANPDTTGGFAANDPTNHMGWPEDRTILAGDTVHFAFDSSSVKASEQVKVTAVADYLKSHSENAVKIEGHCDERGTAEYNRSLGERRAQALREELIKLGVAATSVDTISYGFDQPEDPGHSEASWSKNRRGVFVVLIKPTAATAAK